MKLSGGHHISLISKLKQGKSGKNYTVPVTLLQSWVLDMSKSVGYAQQIMISCAGTQSCCLITHKIQLTEAQLSKFPCSLNFVE